MIYKYSIYFGIGERLLLGVYKLVERWDGLGFLFLDDCLNLWLEMNYLRLMW